ncbi:TRAP transporter small permease [Roseovarius nubinhibens]|uniref:TRAP transporter small permease protein n=1 Tax=Roseovarius nubinhibens TaxID=314263 RepID=A0A348WDI9_9RHOB|nr:TRAP transporter small permease [Roseovarius nubinhibens]MBU3001577.1 TRAP transporter small permease [Roseovarius nubinhibens]HAR52601.1 TRAP transporter permease DctQ [Roseovarius nubinhibens]
MLAKTVQAFNRFELVFSNLSLALLVVVLGLQVFFRYVLHTGLSWSEEISRFAFVWFVYISASLAAQRGTHIRVTLFIGWFPGGRQIALLLADAIWIAFNACVVVAGILLIQRTLAYPVYSTSLFLPLAWIYSVIPLSHALMILRILQRQWDYWRHGIPVIASEAALDHPGPEGTA